MNDISQSIGLPDAGAIEAIVHARHGDPFGVLGPHAVTGGTAVRCFIPGATGIEILARDGGRVLTALEQADPAGFWCGLLPHGPRGGSREGPSGGPSGGPGGEPGAPVPYRLRIISGDRVRETEDPYAFGPTLSDFDIYLLAEGRHREIGQALGGHLAVIDGVPGVRFAVWAPNARRVSVVGSFNGWDGRRHPMRNHSSAGIWDIFIPRIGAGVTYKYEIVGPNGALQPLKADPVAAAAEIPPATASMVVDTAFRWTDAAWMARRAATVATNAPISIYEVHAASWLRPEDAGTDGWTVLAEKLVPYAARMGFTHIELMPIMEHPFGGSWGYQPLGQFAPSARLGPPEGFARLVDCCHEAGIGVLLDWVPAHFPTDGHGLARFDGTPLYEHSDPLEGFHPDWNTYIYNLGRNEVRGFLIGSALYWLEQYHVDGIRVDAVASMLYRDYSRKPGEWVPNRNGGRENLEAVAFLQELSGVMKSRCPGTVLIAEESTDWPGVSRPADAGGLGFDYKWNMGWMHDTLKYIAEDPVHRRWHHDQITFGLVYAFSEHFVLPLSHDEVVYGKGSLIGKMPGDRWRKFANLRAYFGFMWTHPGKKLLFMGGEIAQEREWNHDRSLDWGLLDDPAHAGVQAVVRDLNALYRAEPALHRHDGEPEGFRWLVMDDRDQSVFAYLRLGDPGDRPVIALCNFTPVPRPGYQLGAPQAGVWREALNTDAGVYGGSNIGNGGALVAEDRRHGDWPATLTVTIPPLATLILVGG
jgi:1,4-alpha-glucan branching enzyme